MIFLQPEGLLFTGHAESLGNLGLPLRALGTDRARVLADLLKLLKDPNNGIDEVTEFFRTTEDINHAVHRVNTEADAATLEASVGDIARTLTVGYTDYDDTAESDVYASVRLDRARRRRPQLRQRRRRDDTIRIDVEGRLQVARFLGRLPHAHHDVGRVDVRSLGEGDLDEGLVILLAEDDADRRALIGLQHPWLVQ